MQYLCSLINHIKTEDLKLPVLIIAIILSITTARAQNIDSLLAQREDTTQMIRSDSLVMQFLKYSNISISDNNKVNLIKSGREKFEDLFEDIRGAKNHIHLEYFNFRNDSIANALFELLGEKVKEGVKVRALFDAFGNWSNNKPLKKKHLKAIREKGIEIVKFDPFKFPYINHAIHRDHRKIAIIDGKIGYTGGMNVADYYINGLPKIGAWRDMHIRIEGDAVNDLQNIFLDIWNKTAKEEITGEEYFPKHPVRSDSCNQIVAIVDRTPKHNSRMLSHTYAMSIYAAQSEIRIVNPYFVPTPSIRKALKRALKRGTKVEIMISSKSDIPFTPDATLYAVQKLMKKGADIYLYNGGFHHSKIMMVDNLFCTVGTANLNSRSLRYDYETNAFIFDKNFTRQLNDVFESDTLHCSRLTPEIWKQKSCWKKFKCWFANLFTPVL